jgi:hypothetical protein
LLIDLALSLFSFSRGENAHLTHVALSPCSPFPPCIFSCAAKVAAQVLVEYGYTNVKVLNGACIAMA